MTTRIIVSIAVAAALVAGLDAQAPLALSSQSLAQAIAEGENQAGRGLPLLAARIERDACGEHGR